MDVDIKVIGVHRIEYSATEFDDALEIMWGTNLAGPELENARRETCEHFERLRLIVIEAVPAIARIDWSRVTQPVSGVNPSNWQAPYDKDLVDLARGRWAFFLHFVDSEKPLLNRRRKRSLQGFSIIGTASGRSIRTRRNCMVPVRSNWNRPTAHRGIGRHAAKQTRT